MSEALYLGLDLSTQQLKCVAVQSDLKLKHHAVVDFDVEYKEKYGTIKGVLTNPAEAEIYMPVSMWLEAIDLVLSRLKDAGLDFSLVRGVSGAGMQHGTVFWNHDAEERLKTLDFESTLADQLASATRNAFSDPHSPNWQDASTEKQCRAFDALLQSPERLAEVTGSKSHHRFSGPQILRFREKHPDRYQATSRISIVSSFLASIFLGDIAPIDIGDVCGMNLWHVKTGQWHEDLLGLAAGGPEHVDDLKRKLGHVSEDGGGQLGTISSYFVNRYGFNPGCEIAPFTGDNPATILSLPLREGDAMVSLGTSTTFLMSTKEYRPDPAYHLMNHPTTPGLYMFMLCYKNGSLAREQIRDSINTNEDPGVKAFVSEVSVQPSAKPQYDQWAAFNASVLRTPALCCLDSTFYPYNIGLYFPLREIVPNVKPGRWCYSYHGSESSSSSKGRLDRIHDPDSEINPLHHPRMIIESQLLALRLRSKNALMSPEKVRALPKTPGEDLRPETVQARPLLPAQPRKIFLVGGASVNPVIARLAGDVLGGSEGVYRLELSGNACALGAAYKAVWARERKEGQTFEELISGRWSEEDFVVKVDEGYREGVFELYSDAVPGFERMEQEVVQGMVDGD